MGVAYVLCRVSFSHFDSQFFQVRGYFGLSLVRARHTEPQVGQNFSDARHADATDADEVNVLETPEHILGAPTSCRRSAGILPAWRVKRASRLLQQAVLYQLF